MERSTLIKVVLLVAAIAIVGYFIWRYIQSKQATQQAVQVPMPTATPTPVTPTGPVLPVTFDSYLGAYAGQKVFIPTNIPMMQVGDTYWVPIVAPNGTLVLEAFSINTAQDLIAKGVLTPGTYVTVQVLPYIKSVDLETDQPVMTQQSAAYSPYVYPPYGTSTITLTAGVLRALLRGNVSLMRKLYGALAVGNMAEVQMLLQSYQNNPQMYNILSVLAKPGNLVASLAISYSAAMSLGVVPPAVQVYVTNPSGTVVDFGYA